MESSAQRFGRGGFHAGGFRAGGFRGAYRGGGSLFGPSYRSTAYRGGAFRTPYGGYGARTGTRTTTISPFGSSTRATRGYTHTSPQGYTITGGAAAGRRSGVLGGTTAGAAGGVKVTSPTGQSYYRGGTRRATVGPAGGVAVGGSRVRATAGPFGAAGAGVRRAGALGPGGRVVGTTKAAGGYRLPTDRGLARYSRVTFGRAGYGTVYRSAPILRTQAGYVRRSFVHYNTFTPAWYARYPRAWRPFRWTTATVWAHCAWPTLITWCGYPAVPIYYDYGTTVVYQGDTVYVQGQPVANTAQYAQQAASLADKGKQAQPAANEEWQTLGVFGMVQGEEDNANQIFQLAVNKSGILRGNYYNALSDTTLPIRGSVDAKSQRAAWTVGDNKYPVYEAGIANLTKDQTTVLVHFGENRTQQWLLVRLNQPKNK